MTHELCAPIASSRPAAGKRALLAAWAPDICKVMYFCCHRTSVAVALLRRPLILQRLSACLLRLNFSGGASSKSHATQGGLVSQWAQLKQSQPQHILMFQVGDFYEMFHRFALPSSFCSSAQRQRSQLQNATKKAKPLFSPPAQRCPYGTSRAGCYSHPSVACRL